MPRLRNKENKGLPERWQHTHGAYYYQVPSGFEKYWNGKKKFRLGKTLTESYKVWSQRIEVEDKITCVGDVWERYAREVVPAKAGKTQSNNLKNSVKIMAVFGKMKPDDIRPKDIYQYVDKRGALVAAHREVKLLSHILTKAVEWGYIDRHPFKGETRLTGEKPRTRYVEDWEIAECLSLKSARKKGSIEAIQAYIRLKMITGLRRGDMLRLKIADLREDGIHVTTNKTGKRIIIMWTEELKNAIEEAKKARPVNISPWLFCTRRGQGYVDEQTGEAWGWATMWQRFMKRVLTETKVKDRFTEHDIRAKAASDAESTEHARSLLAHSDTKTTEKIYRRKPSRVVPLR